MRRGRVRSLASVVAATCALTGVTGLAVLSSGVPVNTVEGADSGVWVSTNADNLFGRFNKTARTLDLAVRPPDSTQPTGTLDIHQDGDTVVAQDRGNGSLWPVDTVLGTIQTDGRVNVPPRDATVALRGGTIAVLDKKSGKIWGARYSADDPIPDLAGLERDGEPLASLTSGQNDDTGVAVTEDGTILAADRTGRRIRIAPKGDAFDKPQTVATTVSRKEVRVTSVGDHVVLVDPVEATVQVDDGRPAPLDGVAKGADGKATLQVQQPGPDRPAVLLASARELIAVPLAGGKPEVVFSGGTGSAAPPLVVGDCSYAAWAGKTGRLTEACGDLPPQELFADRETELTQPVLRVNRGYVVLNDQRSGRIFDPKTEALDDSWETVRPKTTSDENAKNAREADKDDPPTANNDSLTVHAGQAAQINPLDNDEDPAGGVLSITAVEGVSNGRATISPDGQTLGVQLAEGKKSMKLRYTITNGLSQKKSEADVTIRAAKGKNKGPNLDTGLTHPKPVVIAGQQAIIPVTMYWRDPENDPIVLTKASAKDPKQGTVSITPDGASVEVEAAAAAAGTMVVEIEVSDGETSQPGKVEIAVQPATSAAVNPVAFPDIVRGVPKHDIVVSPLDNDLPGSDPRDPDATWSLGDVSPEGDAKVTVTTDDSTAVTLRAAQPGTYLVSYTAAYGDGSDRGTIRLDVVDPTKASPEPIVMPDLAVVRGQSPTTVDLLENDVDPRGRLLSVQSVKWADPGKPPPFQAAVVGGRWLRIVPTGKAAAGSISRLTYAVTNGVEQQTGEVSVTTLAPGDQDVVTTRPDRGTVRAGDIATFPVVENDSALSGASLSLLPDAQTEDDLPVGQLPATDDADPSKQVGTAFVAGSSVRYFAPKNLTSERTVNIPYVAQTPDGVRNGAILTVTVKPKPTEDNTGNSPPQPELVEARVPQGETIPIPIPTSGRDPDGDSVTVTAIGSAPKLGRILSVGANNLTYQAYPIGTTLGTDTFTYVVTDRFGLTGTGTVRVAVGTPGQLQPAIPLEDAVTAAPGTDVTVYPAENDLIPRGDPVQVRPLESMNTKLPKGVALDQKAGVVTAPAPAEPDQPLVLAYGLTSQAGQSIPSSITVRSREGFQNPPRVYDVAATLDVDDSGQAKDKPTATAEVLERAYDPDGDSTKLTVTVDDPRATVRGGKVTIDVSGEVPRSIPFTVTDEDGAVAGGAIAVPTARGDGHYLLPDAAIAIEKEQTRNFTLGEYVASTSGKQVHLVEKGLVASPSKLLPKVTATKKLDSFTLTAGDKDGPGAVVVPVVDAAAAKGTPPTVLSIPVTVGTPGPLLTCPTVPFSLSSGSPLRLDIPSVCSVWAADRKDAQAYQARWAGQPIDGVEIKAEGRIVQLTANDAATGSGEVAVFPVGFEGRAETLKITVAEQLPPTLSPVSAQTKGGQTYQVDLRGLMTSPLQSPQFTVLDVRQTGGSNSGVNWKGSVVEITPPGDASGILTFDARASDVSEPDRQATRSATSTIRLQVINKPDPPTDVVAQGAIENGQVRVDFRPGDDNGSPIEYYEVETLGGGSGPKRCTAAPCLITGIEAGQKVRFVVYAVNAVDRSEASAPSPEVIADEVPGAPVGPRVTPGDGFVELAWSAAPTKGSAVTDYEISVDSGSPRSYGPSTTARVSPLTNGESYSFQIRAVNDAGPGPWASTSAMPIGAPDTPANFQAEGVGDGTVNLSWSASRANGPGPVTYAVTDNGVDVSACRTEATSCSTSVTLDGSTHNYVITATNGVPLPSGQASDSYVAVGTPAGATINSIVASGVDQTATLNFTSGPTNGGTGTVTAKIGGVDVGHDTVDSAGGSGSFLITTPDYGSYEVSVTVCNQQVACSDPSTSATVIIYGQLSTPDVNATWDSAAGEIKASASGNGMGKDSSLTLTIAGEAVDVTDSCSGSCSVAGSKAFTPGSTVTTIKVVATIRRSDGSAEVSRSTTAEVPAARNPVVSVSIGDGTGECEGIEGCRSVMVTPTDFPDSTVYCVSEIFNGTSYGPGGDTVTVGSIKTIDYFVPTGSGSVTVTCGDTTGTQTF